MVYDQRLREQHLGIFQGQKRSVFNEAMRKEGIKLLDERDYKVEGGESGIDVYNRAVDFFEREIVSKEFNSDLNDF